MTGRLRWRLLSILAVVLFFGFFTFANFVPEQTRVASPLLPDDGLRLGLHLRGGIHWVLGVKLEVAEEHELQFLRGDLERRAERDDFSLDSLRVEGGLLIVEPSSAKSADEVREWAKASGVVRLAAGDGERLHYTLTDDWRQTVRERGMNQVLEVLRRRIADPVRGIPDSVVTRQGVDRVLVQIPGGQIDRRRARELLRVTGFLEFKIVQATAQTEEILMRKEVASAFQSADGLPGELHVRAYRPSGDGRAAILARIS